MTTNLYHRVAKSKICRIIITNKIYIYPTFILFIVVLLSILKIHGSSIGIYNLLFWGTDYKDPNLIAGHPRIIRGDEWISQTPWEISQYQTGFNPENILFLPGQNFSTEDAPVANWTILFHPQFWSLFILPIENGFAFMWWARAFIFLVSVYFLFLFFSENNIAFSSICSLAYLYSAYFQWWYSTPMIEIIGYGSLIFLAFIKLFNSTSFKFSILYSVVFVYSCMCFVLVFYPPSQIPVAITLLFLIIGYLIAKHASISKERIKRFVYFIGISAFITAILCLLYYFDFKTEILKILNTAYPGHRVSQGGGISLLRMVSGFFDIQIQRKDTVPMFLGNQSEGSSFILLSCFLAPIMVYDIYRSIRAQRKINYMACSLLFVGIILIAWMTLGLPGPIAKITLLFLATPQRIWPAIGLINILLIAIYLFTDKVGLDRHFTKFAIAYSLFAFLIIFFIGYTIRFKSPEYLNNISLIILLSFFTAFAIFLLLIRAKGYFIFLFFVLSFASSYHVNPLYKGLSPLLYSDLSYAIRKINEVDKNKSAWVTYENIYLGNYMAANGVRVLDGTYYSPNIDFWKIFDVENQYGNIYNRYAHAVIKDGPDDSITFELNNPDTFTMNIDYCNPKLKNLKIKYFVLRYIENSHCLNNIYVINYPYPIYIYERK